MLRLATRDDIPEINTILNEPSVYSGGEWPDGSGPADLTNQFDDLLVLMCDGGCFVLHAAGPGELVFHTNFLPGFRGRYVRDAMLEMFRFVFVETNANGLLTKTHFEAKAAQTMAGWVNLRLKGQDETHRIWGIDFLEWALDVNDGPVRDRIWNACAICSNNGYENKAALQFARAAALFGWVMQGPEVEVG